MHTGLKPGFYRLLVMILVALISLSLSAQTAAAQSPGDLSIAVSTTTPAVHSGDPINYTVTVSNTSVSTFTNLAFDIALPETGTGWAVDIASLPPEGAGCSLENSPQGATLHCTLSQLNPLSQESIIVQSTAGPLNACATLSTTASIPLPDGSLVTSAPAAITVSCPSIQIKLLTSTPAVKTGEPVSIEFNVTNLGPGDLTNYVLDLPLPANVLTPWTIIFKSLNLNSFGTCTITGMPQTLHCTLPQLNPNQPADITVASTAGPVPFCTTLTARGKIWADNYGPVSPNPLTIPVCPPLTITTTTTTPNVNPGDGVSLTVLITNISTVQVDELVFDMVLPVNGGRTWVIGNKDLDLAATGTCILSGSPQTLHCTQPGLAAGRITWVNIESTVAVSTCTLMAANATVSANNVLPLDSLFAEIYADCPPLELFLFTDTPAVNVGETFDFLFGARNTTPNPLTNVAWDIVLPEIGHPWLFQDGATTSGFCTFNGRNSLHCAYPSQVHDMQYELSLYAVATPMTACTTLSATMTVTADGISPETSDPVNVNVSCPLLGASVSTTTPTVNVGDPINFQLQLSNTGPSPANNVVLNLPLPANGDQLWVYDNAVFQFPTGTQCNLINSGSPNFHCTIPQLDPGQVAQVRLQATADPASACTTLSTVATVSADHVPAFTSTSDTISVSCADLVLSKRHTGVFYQGLRGAAYTLTAANAGLSPTAGPVSVVEALPAGLSATGLSGAGWTCTLAALTCTRADALAGGANYPDITLTVNVAPDAPTSLTNQAEVSGGGELNTANDSASDVTPVTSIAGLITPSTATCGQFASNNAASLSAVTYTVQSGKIKSVTPSTFLYYSKVIAPSASFQIQIAQSNTGGWLNLPDPQFNVFDANCAEIKVKTTLKPNLVTFQISGATAGAVYFVSVRYQANSVVGRKVTVPYPTIPYTFTTALNTVVIGVNTRTINFEPPG